MSDYSAKLNLAVTSSGLDSADKGLNKIEKSGKRAERATDQVGGAFKRVLAPIAAFVSVTAGLNKLVNVTRQFEVFNASLKTATGSAENAAVAFEALENFAAETPYALEQSVEAFVKLTNLGLDPSERALRSYGDTASAMGKDLNQLIEAVADAATGEFERLKEFGIKASSQGDNVAFTFRGVTTTVKKNADEIQEYLTQIGENNFAGNMTERMKGLDGAISNLGDTWDRTFRLISEQGPDSTITTVITTAAEALDEFNKMLDSGELAGYIDAMIGQFDGFGRDVTETFNILNGVVADAMEFWDEVSSGTATNIVDGIDTELSHIPANIRALVQLMAVEFGSIVTYGSEYGAAYAKAFGVEIAKLVDKVGIYGKELVDILNIFDGDSFDFEAAIAQADATAADMTDSYFEAAEAQVEASRKARLESIKFIIDERNTATGAVDDQIEKVQQLRFEYDELNKTRKVGLDDIPKRESTGGTETPTGPDAASKREFAKLIDNVIPPDDKINEVFASRLKLIEENTVSGSEKQAELIGRLNEKYATDILKGFDVEPDENDFSAKIDKINEEFEARRNVILENTQLTEEQRTTLETQLTKSRNKQIEALENAKAKAQIGIAKSALGNLSSLMNSESKKAFQIGKVAAIANAVVSGIESTVHAYKAGAQIGGPPLGAAFAATAAIATGVQIQQLKAQQFGGGGTVSSGGASGTANVYQPSQPTIPNGPQLSGTGAANQQPKVEIIFNGPINGIDEEQLARTLLEPIRDAVSESDFVLIESTSRNGRELAA